MKRSNSLYIAIALLVVTPFIGNSQNQSTYSSTSDNIDYNITEIHAKQTLSTVTVQKKLTLDINPNDYIQLYLSSVDNKENYALQVKRSIIIADIPNGTYIVKLMDKNKNVIDYKRIIIKH